MGLSSPIFLWAKFSLVLNDSNTLHLEVSIRSTPTNFQKINMNLNSNSQYLDLGCPKRIWAIPSIHANIQKLADIHDTLYCHIAPGDRIVYLGNYTGYGEHPIETINELLTFRRNVLSIPGIIPSDIVYLRGLQEELWDKLLQLQFAPNPLQCMEWILNQGLEATLMRYGSSAQEAYGVSREGVMSLTKWTNRIRERARRHAGHEKFRTQLKRAALTVESTGTAPLLFVNAGIDISKSLDHQGDSFWYDGKRFSEIETPYQNFSKVVRGYDPSHAGLHLNCVTATLDAGCGFGGPLISACIDTDGNIENIFEAA